MSFSATQFASGFAPLAYNVSSGGVSQSLYAFFAGTNPERLGVAYIGYTGGGSDPAAVYGAAYFSETSCTH